MGYLMIARSATGDPQMAERASITGHPVLSTLQHNTPPAPRPSESAWHRAVLGGGGAFGIIARGCAALCRRQEACAGHSAEMRYCRSTAGRDLFSGGCPHATYGSAGASPCPGQARQPEAARRHSGLRRHGGSCATSPGKTGGGLYDSCKHTSEGTTSISEMVKTSIRD
jgi:hypothetical protein